MPAFATPGRASSRGGQIPPKEVRKPKQLPVDLAVVDLEVDPQGSPPRFICAICEKPCLGFYGILHGRGACSSLCYERVKEDGPPDV